MKLEGFTPFQVAGEEPQGLSLSLPVMRVAQPAASADEHGRLDPVQAWLPPTRAEVFFAIKAIGGGLEVTAKYLEGYSE